MVYFFLVTMLIKSPEISLCNQCPKDPAVLKIATRSKILCVVNILRITAVIRYRDYPCANAISLGFTDVFPRTKGRGCSKIGGRSKNTTV